MLFNYYSLLNKKYTFKDINIVKYYENDTNKNYNNITYIKNDIINKIKNSSLKKNDYLLIEYLGKKYDNDLTIDYLNENKDILLKNNSGKEFTINFIKKNIQNDNENDINLEFINNDNSNSIKKGL